MKKTTTLAMAPSMHIPKGRVVLHPNEGFDLGLMRINHPVKWCSNLPVQDFLKGQDGSTQDLQVDLLNECPRQTIQMNQSHWKTLGSPAKGIVLIDGDRLYIQPLTT